MSEVTENLIREQLRVMQTDIRNLKGDAAPITARCTSIERHIAALQSDYARTNVRLDQLTARVEGLEQRVGLVDRHTPALDARTLAARARLNKKGTETEK